MRSILGLMMGLAFGCAGQTAELEGVLSGVLFDAPSRAIRTVNGIPGAAYMGVEVAGGVDAAWVAPDGRSAVVEREGERFLVKRLRTAESEWVGLTDVTVRPELVAWSADSRTAAVLGPNEIRVLKTEGGTSARELPGKVVALAVAGETVFTAVKDGETGGIYRSGVDGAWTLLAALKGGAKLALGGNGTLYALEEGSGDVMVMGEDGGALVVAAGTGAMALRVTADGKRLLLAHGGEEAHIGVFDLAAKREAARVVLDGPPQGLEALPGSAHVVVTQRKRDGDVITVLAEQAGGPAVFFVPAGE